MIRAHVHHRIDANCAEIRDKLREHGCSVNVINGDFDLLVGIFGLNIVLEVKNPERMSKAGKSKDSKRQARQRKFRDEWRGQYAQVTSFVGAVAAIRRHLEGTCDGRPMSKAMYTFCSDVMTRIEKGLE